MSVVQLHVPPDVVSALAHVRQVEMGPVDRHASIEGSLSELVSMRVETSELNENLAPLATAIRYCAYRLADRCSLTLHLYDRGKVSEMDIEPNVSAANICETLTDFLSHSVK